MWQHVDWYCIWWPPPPSPPRPPPHPQMRAPDLSGHCRTSTASARFQWALPGPNCDRGSQWAQPDTTSARSQWALPLPYQMGGAVPASQGFRGSFAKLSRISGHIYRNLWIMYPYGSRYIWGSCLQTYLKPGFWVLKVSFASFRGRKSSQKLSRIFRERGFSFRGAILLYTPFKSPLGGFGGCSIGGVHMVHHCFILL